MKNILLSLFFLFVATAAFAQKEQMQYYEYNIFSFAEMTEKIFTIDVDNGKTIEKLKDEKGNKIKFKTPAAALTYLISLGWEFYVKGEYSGSTYQGTGNTSNIYWIMRRPCTKEEFETAVQDAVFE